MTISKADAVPRLGATRRTGDEESRRPERKQYPRQSGQDFETALHRALDKRGMLGDKLLLIALQFRPLPIGQRAAIAAYDVADAPATLPPGFFLKVAV
ncbi:hypothetical protein D4R49_00845 [bacterium]|nr:MAG: hypothetical protein D4R49_00845 [bacterium]